MSYAAKAWYSALVALLTGLLMAVGGAGIVLGISGEELLGSLLAAVVAWGGTYGIANTPTTTVVTTTRDHTNGNAPPVAR